MRGGLWALWDVLDKRYPEKVRMDKKGEALDAIFKLRPYKQEYTLAYTGRGRPVFTKAASLQIIFDSIISKLISPASRNDGDSSSLNFVGPQQGFVQILRQTGLIRNPHSVRAPPVEPIRMDDLGLRFDGHGNLR